MKKIILYSIWVFAFSMMKLNAQEYHLGQVIENPDGSKGVVFYLNEDGTNGWMVALHDVPGSFPWGSVGTIPELSNYEVVGSEYLTSVFADRNGYQNTEIIRSYYQSIGYTGSYAAGVVDFENGWYLPSAGQLSILYHNMVLYEPMLKTVGEPIGLNDYWSSTPMSETEAWAVSFGAPMYQEYWQWNGHFKHFAKYSSTDDNMRELKVRPIRDLNTVSMPSVGNIEAPALLCDSGELDLTLPTMVNVDTCGWEISPDESFTTVVPYTGQTLDFSYDGWYLRLWAKHEDRVVYSNVVSITIHYIGVGQIEGESWIYYATMGDFTYHVDPVPGCMGYEWRIDNGWEITTSPQDPQCVVHISSSGRATLTLHVYTDCGYTERSIEIIHDQKPGFNVYPNPNDGIFNMSLYGMEGEVIVEVFDYLGQLVDRFEVNTTVYGTTIPCTLRGKATGLYVLSVKNKDYQVMTKVVKNSSCSFGVRPWYY